MFQVDFNHDLQRYETTQIVQVRKYLIQEVVLLHQLL